MSTSQNFWAVTMSVLLVAWVPSTCATAVHISGHGQISQELAGRTLTSDAGDTSLVLAETAARRGRPDCIALCDSSCRCMVVTSACSAICDRCLSEGIPCGLIEEKYRPKFKSRFTSGSKDLAPAVHVYATSSTLFGSHPFLRGIPPLPPFPSDEFDPFAPHLSLDLGVPHAAKSYIPSAHGPVPAPSNFPVSVSQFPRLRSSPWSSSSSESSHNASNRTESSESGESTEHTLKSGALSELSEHSASHHSSSGGSSKSHHGHSSASGSSAGKSHHSSSSGSGESHHSSSSGSSGSHHSSSTESGESHHSSSGGSSKPHHSSSSGSGESHHSSSSGSSGSHHSSSISSGSSGSHHSSSRESIESGHKSQNERSHSSEHGSSGSVWSVSGNVTPVSKQNAAENAHVAAMEAKLSLIMELQNTILKMLKERELEKVNAKSESSAHSRTESAIAIPGSSAAASNAAASKIASNQLELSPALRSVIVARLQALLGLDMHAGASPTVSTPSPNAQHADELVAHGPFERLVRGANDRALQDLKRPLTGPAAMVVQRLHETRLARVAQDMEQLIEWVKQRKPHPRDTSYGSERHVQELLDEAVRIANIDRTLSGLARAQSVQQSHGGRSSASHSDSIDNHGNGVSSLSRGAAAVASDGAVEPQYVSSEAFAHDHADTTSTAT